MNPNIKSKISTFCILFIICLVCNNAFAQSDVINNVKAALKSGSSKELIKFCNDRVDLNIDHETNNYSRVQAEFILKDFFKKYPPSDFQYIHQGASKEGLKYAIGKYSYNNGSFRTLIRLRQAKDKTYYVYAIDFTEE
jgi:hypothetical protein